MKIIEAIGSLDSLKHNTYTYTDKVGWLNRVESMVQKLIIDTRQDSGAGMFQGYDEHTDPDTVLLVPAPFDELYLRWMEAQIDYYNGEITRYNESITMFNTAWANFEGWYSRNHMPRAKKIKYF